jgi:glutamate synthase (NADPH) small chain
MASPISNCNKNIIDRRQKVLEAEGIKFIVNTKVGVDISHKELVTKYDAICLAVGAMVPRDLPAEGRNLEGVYFAMDFLRQQNKIVRGIKITDQERIIAEGKNVLVIGGGDTGSDCVGTSVRQKAASVTQIEIMPKPPKERQDNNPWPYWPNTLRTSSSHKEGCERRWSLATKKFIGEKGKLTGAEVVKVEWVKDENGRMAMQEIPGTNEIIKAELILLSMGFLHAEHSGLLDSLKLAYDPRGNVKTDRVKLQSSEEKVFACGDAQTGASLVVRAIDSGRKCAEQIDQYLVTK